MARSRLAGAFFGGFEQRPAFAPDALGERDQQNRIRHRDSDRHDRAHERLDVQRRAGDHSISSTPHSTAGIVSTMASASRDGLEVRRQQKKDRQYRQQQADSQPGDGLLRAAESGPRSRTLTPRGGAPAAASALIQLRRRLRPA